MFYWRIYASLGLNEFKDLTHGGWRENGCHFADNISKDIFSMEIIVIWLKYVPKGPIVNKSTLVQVMAWCKTGHKPLTELMMTKFKMPHSVRKPQWVNSLAPGRPRCHFKTAIFNLVLLTGIFTLSKDNVLRWMPRDLTDDNSTLVQVMAWCRQATSHYLSQCWPSSMSPYGVTRPQ